MDIKPDRHINLLLFGKGESSLLSIKKFCGLMSYLTKHQGRTHYCYNYLHEFAFKETLGQHIELCYKQKTQAIKLPHKPEDKEVSFKKQLPMSFIIYAHFEAYTTKINEPQHGNTTMYQRYIPSGLGTWLSALIHNTQSLQSSTEEMM